MIGAAILAILKVIGIVLLWILLIAAILIALILFVPVTYHAEGFYRNKDGEAKFRVSWLLRLVCFSGEFRDRSLHYRLRILFFTILSSDKKRKKKTEALPEDASIQPAETAAGSSQTEYTGSAGSGGAADSEAQLFSDEDEENTSSGKRRGKKKGKIREIFSKLRAAWDWLHDPANDELIELIKTSAGRLIRHILPRYLYLQGIVGFEDPAKTAEVLALVYMLYPLYGSSVRVIGDFEEQRLEGEGEVSGRIFGIVVLSIAVKLFLNKEFRRLLKKLLRPRPQMTQNAESVS